MNLRKIRKVGTSGTPRCELDSHADTCVAGANCRLISHEGRKVSVHPYSEEYKPIHDVIIGSVATLWVDPTDGQSYILIIHEALYFGKRLADTLLCPNQLRAHGLKVQDVPKQFDSQSSHSILLPKGQVCIQLELDGVISGFETSRPTRQEYEEYPHLELTSSLPWKPTSASFANEEQRHVSSTQRLTQDGDLRFENHYRQVAAVASYHSSQSPVEFDDDLFHSLGTTVHAASDDIEGNGLKGHVDADVYPVSDEGRRLFSLSTGEQRSVLTPEVLSQRWNIGLASARRTMQSTTQSGIRNVLAPGERKLRQRLDHLKYPTLKGRFYSDTSFANIKSLRKHAAAQHFTNGLGYDRFYPMASKSQCSTALMAFIQQAGIPQILITDNAPEEVAGEFKETCRVHHIQQKFVVPHSPWMNLAEASVRAIKQGIQRATRRKRSPKRLWCYCGQWVAAVRRLTALDLPQLDGRVPEEFVMGSTPDISPYAQFDWYEPVWYIMPEAKFPHEKKRLGRWLGIAEVSTDVMASFILTETGKVIVRKSIWAISVDERATDEIKAAMTQLDVAITAKVGDSVRPKDFDPDLADDIMEVPDDIFTDSGDEDVVVPYDQDATQQEADDSTPEAYDQYLTAEVLLPHGGEMLKAKVVGRKKDANGNPMGKRNNNPLLDSRTYEVEFPDGSTDAFTANLIAENILSQVDAEGKSYAIISEIVDHRKNGDALSKDDAMKNTRSGGSTMRHTTKGWALQVEWKDGTTSWVPLKDLKESNPVELAEYAVANKIVEEPAFAWWVRPVLRRRDRILKKVKSRYWSKTHKFGIELPKSVAESLAIDRRTGTEFWRLAIEKEMKNVMPAFESRDDNVVPIGYKQIPCHMIFDVKMDLTRKARLVAGGHVTDPPKDSTYSSVVSRDSVRIAFTLAALNDLEVLSADVQNAYLYAPTKERVYTIAGPEFGGTNVGRPVLIVRALYGLKSSGARWRDHMAQTLRDGGFQSCLADPDVWMKPRVKPNGDKYWEYILCYVDDLLVVSHAPQETMDMLSEKYTLKAGSVKPPDAYLGAEIRIWNIEDSDEPPKTRWGMSSDLYVKRAIADVEQELELVGKFLPTRAQTPITCGYRPELDTTAELDAKRANYYQGLIGILRWMVELGRVDILTPIAMLSRYLAAPRTGHLDQVFHIFGYLKKYNKSTMVFDDTIPFFDESRFAVCDWAEFYPGACEPEPPKAPELRGQSITMSCFVDADHAGCRVTRRSHTGVLIFINRAPILWYSKRQNTVESSTFGSEFVAMKTAVEQVEGLRYKLRMMGIEVDGPTNVFCDNESVVMNTTRPESTLKKKHNAIAYHRTREAQAAGIIRIAKEDGETNLADLFTKLVPGPRLRDLAGKILW